MDFIIDPKTIRLSSGERHELLDALNVAIRSAVAAEARVKSVAGKEKQEDRIAAFCDLRTRITKLHDES